jgi:hypothetical protein
MSNYSFRFEAVSPRRQESFARSSLSKAIAQSSFSARTMNLPAYFPLRKCTDARSEDVELTVTSELSDVGALSHPLFRRFVNEA